MRQLRYRINQQHLRLMGKPENQESLSIVAPLQLQTNFDKKQPFRLAVPPEYVDRPVRENRLFSEAM